MDPGHELRRLSQYLPALPADVADRIAWAIAAESVRRTDVAGRGSHGPVAVPRQRAGAGRAVASYVPQPRPAVGLA